MKKGGNVRGFLLSEGGYLHVPSVLEEFQLQALHLAEAVPVVVTCGKDGLSHIAFDENTPETALEVSGPSAARPTSERGSGSFDNWPDRSSSFLRDRLPLLDRHVPLPNLEELAALLQAGVCKQGVRMLLPVSDRKYHELVAKDETWAQWVEPVSSSCAFALQEFVHTVLDLEVEQPGSRLVMPEAVDRVLYHVIKFCTQRLDGLPMKRQRSVSDDSITLHRMRPGFWLQVANCLLLTGEDKALGNEMGEAKQELINKLKTWSAAYHGQVEYLLCYAAAGTLLELCALPLTTEHSAANAPHLLDLLGPLDLTQPRQRLKAMHAAMIIYCIISKQCRQLPTQHLLLGSSGVC